MKKLFILTITTILLISNIPVFAVNIGTYKTDTEYGLFDGFKINWKRTDKSTPFIEPREQSTREEREKERKEMNKDEYQYTKYLYDGQVVM